MDAEDAAYYRRQGFWLRMAREHAGKNQAGAAEQIGLEATSKSTISDYENAVQVPPQPALRKLARWYGVPVSLFTSPPPTSDELIESLIREASRGGADAERQDWASGPEPDPGADDEPDDGPDTLPA